MQAYSRASALRVPPAAPVGARYIVPSLVTPTAYSPASHATVVPSPAMNGAAGAAIERAAVAEERAAIANQKAEAEHIARVKLASAIAPRSLAISQIREIVDELRPVANADIHITVEISLGNSGGLGIQIYNA